MVINHPRTSGDRSSQRSSRAAPRVDPRGRDADRRSSCSCAWPRCPSRAGAWARSPTCAFAPRGWRVVAILGQIVIISLLPQGNGWLHHAVHLATYALIAAFLWANRHIAYLWLAALGGALNLAAITANGGVMPADPDALAAAGVHQEAGDFANSTAVAHPHLAFLGDVFAVPASWPVSNVFSVGDVVLVVAALLALHCLCGSRLALVRFAAPLAR